MVEDNFVEETFAEITADETAQILANAKVVSALKGKSAVLGTIKIGEEDIRFKLTVSKKLRRKMELYKKRAEDKEPDMNSINTLMYDLLSSLCIDEPWTNWKTWSVYDEDADAGAMEVLFEMLGQVKGHMEDVKDFRGRAGRITTVKNMQVPVSEAGRRPDINR